MFKLWTLLVFWALFTISQARVVARHKGHAEDHFSNPPKNFRPKFRYWLPDASVSHEVVANDVKAIASIGAGGFELLPFYLYGYVPAQGINAGRPPPTDWNVYGFGTPAFVSILTDTLEAVQKNDVLMDFALGPNQGAGVPAVALTPGLSVQLLMGNVSIPGGKSYNGPVPPPQPASDIINSGLGFMQPLLDFGTPKLVAVTAMEVLSTGVQNFTVGLGTTAIPFPTITLNESSFVDLTGLSSAGNLYWEAPEGNNTWRIISFWETYTNQKECAGGANPTSFIGNGSWIVDHFSAKGAQITTDFWDQYVLSNAEVANLIKAVGNYGWEDSMEILASLYWTPDFLERFEQHRGYSALPYLPMFFNLTNSWNGALPTYFELYSYGNYSHLLDYRTTLNEGYQDYISHFEQWTHSRGIEYSDQPAYNLPMEMLADIPLLDAPEGESLGFQDNIDAYRQFSGPAHLSGRDVISTEVGAVGQPPYSQTIPNLLYHIRLSLAGGFTMGVIHGSPYSSNYPNTTWPGYTTFFYMYTEMWNSLQPCWNHMKDELDYMGRNQYILQQGVPKVDLAFYLYNSQWQPNTVYQSTNLEELGYTYDYLGPNNLISSAAVVGEKVLAPNGPSYKALIFSNQTVMSTAAMEAVYKMTTEGLPVIFIGQAPMQVLSGRQEDQNQFDKAMETLLGAKNVYQIASANELPQTLTSIDINPRASLSCSSMSVYSQWRSDSGSGVEYAFFFNGQQGSTSCQARLTTAGTAMPFVYNAWTSTKLPLLTYTRTDSGLQMNFTLQTNETLLIGLHSANNCPTTAPYCSISSVSNPSNVLSSTYDATKRAIEANILGPVTFTMSSGKTHSFNNVSPPSATQLATWNLTLDSWHPPADIFNVSTDITTYTFANQALVPWSELGNGLEAVSGIGRYTTRVTVPQSTNQLGAVLILGPIQHTVRARIDNIALPPVDPSNPTIDMTPYIAHLKSGASFELEVEVSSPLFNTVKANADRIMIWGYTADHQAMYQTMDYMKNGLLGPVSVQWGQVVEWQACK